jgi:hypothetical protein
MPYFPVYFRRPFSPSPAQCRHHPHQHSPHQEYIVDPAGSRIAHPESPGHHTRPDRHMLRPARPAGTPGVLIVMHYAHILYVDTARERRGTKRNAPERSGTLGNVCAGSGTVSARGTGILPVRPTDVPPVSSGATADLGESSRVAAFAVVSAFRGSASCPEPPSPGPDSASLRRTRPLPSRERGEDSSAPGSVFAGAVSASLFTTHFALSSALAKEHPTGHSGVAYIVTILVGECQKKSWKHCRISTGHSPIQARPAILLPPRPCELELQTYWTVADSKKSPDTCRARRTE